MKCQKNHKQYLTNYLLLRAKKSFNYAKMDKKAKTPLTIHK
jgi:hypothetical protein